VVAEKGGGEAQTEAGTSKDASEAETVALLKNGDAADPDPDPLATPPFPERDAAAESDAWQSTAVGFGDTSKRKQEQIAQDLAEALAAMDANVTRSPPPPPRPRGSRKSPPPVMSDAARDAADAAEASAADAAEATSREARHEAAETDAERRARHAKEDEERRARHEKEDRERAEKHAMEDELRELRAAASEPAKDREPFSFGEAEATTSVGALVADDATSDSASDSDPIVDPDDPARVPSARRRRRRRRRAAGRDGASRDSLERDSPG
jgi:ribonuclease E